MVCSTGEGEGCVAEIADDIALDYAVLTEQAEALRSAGRHAAADQVLAWRDVHARRHSGGEG